MEELIFFAVIIFFSIIESIARSRRAKAKKQSGEPAEPERFEWAQEPPWEAELPTYDEEPSYDEKPSYDEEPSYDERLAASTTATEEPEAPPTLSDIWAEIAGLATQGDERAGARTRPAPRQSPPLPESSPDERTRRGDRVAAAPARSRSRLPEHAPAPVHEVHLAHADYGTDPSERPASEQDGLDPLAQRMSANAAAVHGQLRSRKPSELRQAIILKEVLAAPLSLRE